MPVKPHLGRTLPGTFAALALLLACACQNDAATSQPFELQLRAELPDTSPLAGARFWLAGRELGPTGADGTLRTTVAGREGDELRVTGLCPTGHQGPSAPRALKLRHVTNTSGRKAATLELTFRCTPELTRAALVVRARRGDKPLALPILVDGRVVGQTDAQGVAHVLVRSAPHASLQARLDTKGAPELQPRDPVRIFDLEDTDTVLLFDQTFETRKPAPHPHATRPVPRRVPYRIQ